MMTQSSQANPWLEVLDRQWDMMLALSTTMRCLKYICVISMFTTVTTCLQWQVKVWFLESVSDFWEWLVPGHNANGYTYTQFGAFFHFAAMGPSRDFEIRKDIALCCDWQLFCAMPMTRHDIHRIQRCNNIHRSLEARIGSDFGQNSSWPPVSTNSRAQSWTTRPPKSSWLASKKT